ncbi:GDSL esterase/lipase At1g71250 isoform X1 [Syzygium oleosum]|uniref:GDSL esterase/lipase At1g71250 isoform X1 n=1 Tax=Syzygium oleosum TaxID=219896 RepID=UPI0024B95F8E|nr:GDSL esterase/lipase At1g71250 isoform X1 [Syzygium oleosum]
MIGFSERPWLVAVLLMVSIVQCVNVALGSQKVPAMFVFGDSIVDVGNNNYLRSYAKCNYPPYGIDYPGGPSGRFSNGKNIVDMLGDMLGLPSPPAYADPSTTGAKIVGGVNYASAAGGILDETGRHYGEKYSLSQQVLNFENTLNQLRTMLDGAALSRYLAGSIAVMVIGSNDYISNYLLPSLYPSSYTYSPQDYGNLLINRYARQILALNSVGLRKFFLAGIPPLGCIPNQRARSQYPDRCVDSVNQMLGTFNEGLRSLVQQLNSNHPGSIFIYGNTYGAMGDILNNPAAYGFSVVDNACCGIGRNQGEITCIPFLVPCPDRTRQVFWDAFHLTQAASSVLTQRAFYGPPSDCYPINIQQMAQL